MVKSVAAICLRILSTISASSMTIAVLRPSTAVAPHPLLLKNQFALLCSSHLTYRSSSNFLLIGNSVSWGAAYFSYLSHENRKASTIAAALWASPLSLGDCDCVSELGRLGCDELPEKSSEITCQAIKTAPNQIMALWSVLFIMKVDLDEDSRID
jgi:hypothetical protein